ncbi:MAG TPA: hypothetical protein VGD79_12490 [Thermoanaerobaculia bacterium]|jgi:hypothetical protein
MKQPILFAIVACALGLCLTSPAEAQEVQCLACLLSPVTYNSYCQTYNGNWPDCQTVCDGYYCACNRGTSGGRCSRGGDGVWRGFRVQDVYYMPVDRPFHAAYRVTRARMTRRPA